MSRGFSRWIRSKAGMGTLAGVLVVLLVVVVAGQFLGWWATLGNLVTGTAGPAPAPGYPTPEGGYTCLPTCFDGMTDYDGDGEPEPQDGRFLSMPTAGLESFGGESIVVWISVPGDQDSFELGIFDGDAGKDDDGNLVGWRGGNWDGVTVESTFTLYADPLKDGAGSQVVGEWHGNQDNMPNNDWYNVTVDNVPEAVGPSGHYFYRLEITGPTEAGPGLNRVKLRSTGYLSTGSSELVDASFAIVGGPQTVDDLYWVYPDFEGDLSAELGPSTYTGDWQFYFYIPEDTTELCIWDGDFDRGTSGTEDPDTDDFNTEGKPPWANPAAVDERAGGRGAPADDVRNRFLLREPPVWYEFVDPDGEPLYTNEEPSGTEEWEHFTVCTDPSNNPDLVVDEIEPGFYGLNIVGLDAGNTVWLRLNYEIVPQIPPPNCDASCPRTIGYWKNNVKKVLIEERTRGIQESKESLEAALRNVALKSELFRSGIDVCNPQPIDDPVPLTAEEAHMILQRNSKQAGYPDCDGGDGGNGKGKGKGGGGPKSENTMLARALQQTLATWLNWGSGKICDTTYVELNVPDGGFEGTIDEALAESQDIILNGGNLERAKDIGDQINNGNLGEDASKELTQCDITDPDDKNTEPYRENFPPEKQPPKYKDMKKAPEKELPEQVETEPQPDPETCEGVRVNQYNVENTTNNPFYGIKFEYVSGTEVKNGDFDEFRFTVTEDEAAAMESVQMEAKAGQHQGQATLEGCDFTSFVGCYHEPVKDEDGNFGFSFMGAEDNEDGTLTLTFLVYNFTDKGLSHATVGLPDGVVPSSPSGSYESRICP